VILVPFSNLPTSNRFILLRDSPCSQHFPPTLPSRVEPSLPWIFHPISHFNLQERVVCPPTTVSSLFSPHLPIDLQNPPLDHRPLPEPRYTHIYVIFGAGMLHKEIDMHTVDNPNRTMGSPDGTVRLIPYHVPTYVHTRVSVLQIVQSGYLCRPALHTLRDLLSWFWEDSAS
jgi:hypothetical protein